MKRNELLLKFYCSISAIFIVNAASAQNTIGIPNIINYTKQAYGAGSQNWGIVQDKSGIMYFGNNDGLLTFDGSYWRIYPLPNKTIVRSVAIGADNRIYVGGQKEIGYFLPGPSGELVYTSLNKLIPVNDNDFADVWHICFFDNHVFFRSNKKILDYHNNSITVYSSTNWGFLSTVAGELLAYESDRGELLKFVNGQWLPKLKFGSFPKDNIYLRTALEIGKDSTLFVSLVHGFFLLHKDSLFNFITPDLQRITSQNISDACLLSTGRIALMTNLTGCIVISKEGKFIQRFTKQEGIQNNNVRTGFVDRDKNLWLGSDNGIDLITCNNAIKNIFPDNESRNTGYSSAIYNGQLYMGLSTGVFKIVLAGDKDISYTNGSFNLVKNSEGQVWSLDTVNGKLMMGHNNGGFVINNDEARLIDKKTGFWAFHAMPGGQAGMFAGTYSGISFFDKDGLSYSATPFESARFIAIGKNIIWAAHPYKGIYSINIEEGRPPIATVYNDKQHILSANHNKVFKLDGKIILTSDKGIFEYDDAVKDFVRATWLESLTGKAPVSYFKQDASGNIWYCRDRKLAVIDRSTSPARTFFIPELDNRIISNGFENINILDSNNIIIAAEKGFFHINYSLYKKNREQIGVLIRKVQSPLQSGEPLYGGYAAPGTVPSIAYQFNALHFEYSSTLYGQEQNTEYSYWLDGFDKNWSEWSKRREKDYTNLPPGKYTFKVKCRNNVDSESTVTSYSFSILPPWYRTFWAYAVYAIIFFTALYWFYKNQQRKYKRQQQLKLQEQQRKYNEEQKQLQLQHQIEIQESEKQIIQLTNEKLQAEVGHKNSELASSAMNLVRKKEMLSKLKEDLLRYKETPEADKSAKEFQKIIKLLNSELDQEGEWEQFAGHFDSVHSNYLKKLKAHCPALTVSDLKLAAYLRLNLSTKEIAQLLNISTRGVETSRYRLRKKLEIENETNLFDYLARITA